MYSFTRKRLRSFVEQVPVRRVNFTSVLMLGPIHVVTGKEDRYHFSNSHKFQGYFSKTKRDKQGMSTGYFYVQHK